MKRLSTILIAAVLATTLAGVASAHPGAGRVERREARQQIRVRDGVRCGQITPREARRLRMHQRHVRRMEHRAMRDGRLGVRERARIHRSLDRQGRMIFRYRHNGRNC